MTAAVLSADQAQARLDAAKKRLRVVRARDDLEFFLKTYFPDDFSTDFGDEQLELIAKLQSKTGTGARVVRALPREHGKTTILQGYAIWCCVTGRKTFPAVICEEKGKAVLWLTWVRDHLETNDLLREDFGDLVGTETWGKETFVTSNGCRFMARGPKTSVRGLKHRNRRPDLVIVDDLEKDDLINTIEQRDLMEMWLKKALLNILPEDGDFVMIGTKIHHDAVLTRVLAYPSFDSKSVSAFKADGMTPIWPERWSLKRLLDKREEIGSEAFATEYLNEPIDEKTAPFKRKDKSGVPYGHLYMPDDLIVPGSKPPVERLLYNFLTIDPAWSGSRKAHWAAMMVVGVDEWGHWWIRDMFKEHCSELDMAESVIALHSRWGFILGGIETVFNQRGFKQTIEEMMVKRGKVFELRDLKATVGTKDMRIRSTLIPVWENRILHIPANHKHTPALLDELFTYPKGKSDDLIDALAYVSQVAFVPPPEAERRREMGGRNVSIVDKTTGYVHTETAYDPGDEEDD